MYNAACKDEYRRYIYRTQQLTCLDDFFSSNSILDLVHEQLLKTSDRCSTQLPEMSIDPKFVELTAEVCYHNFIIYIDCFFFAPELQKPNCTGPFLEMLTTRSDTSWRRTSFCGSRQRKSSRTRNSRGRAPAEASMRTPALKSLRLRTVISWSKRSGGWRRGVVSCCFRFYRFFFP